jgi:hypothetical protein
MIKKGSRYFVLILMLLAASVALAMKPGWQKTLMYMSGSVIPHGSRTLTFTENHSQWLSVEGERWLTRERQEEAAAYYALVIPPHVALRDDGFRSINDGISHVDTMKWIRESDLGGGSLEIESKSLTISYHGIEREVIIGSDTYPLVDGNLFVIHLDNNWNPHVIQINSQLNKIDGFDEARAIVRRALPDDEMLK